MGRTPLLRLRKVRQVGLCDVKVLSHDLLWRVRKPLRGRNSQVST